MPKGMEQRTEDYFIGKERRSRQGVGGTAETETFEKKWVDYKRKKSVLRRVYLGKEREMSRGSQGLQQKGSNTTGGN